MDADNLTKNRHANVSLQHVALHLTKYAGEVASIAEHLDHPGDAEKRAKALRLAQRWLGGRKNALHWATMEVRDQLQAFVARETNQAGLPLPCVECGDAVLPVAGWPGKFACDGCGLVPGVAA